MCAEAKSSRQHCARSEVWAQSGLKHQIGKQPVRNEAAIVSVDAQRLIGLNIYIFFKKKKKSLSCANHTKNN